MIGWVIGIVIILIIIAAIVGIVIYMRNRNRALAAATGAAIIENVTDGTIRGDVETIRQQVTDNLVRYVRLYRSTGEIINIEEVEVGTPPLYEDNIALRASTTSTSVHDTGMFPPSNITDGTSAFFHSEVGAVGPQSVTIDLEIPRPLPLQVRIRNRPDGYWDRAIGIQVQLLNSNQQLVAERTIETSEREYLFLFE